MRFSLQSHKVLLIDAKNWAQSSRQDFSHHISASESKYQIDEKIHMTGIFIGISSENLLVSPELQVWGQDLLHKRAKVQLPFYFPINFG